MGSRSIANEQVEAWARFPATRSSAIRALSHGAEERAWALDALARAYWPAIYRYVRINWRKPPAESEELTQDFLLMMVEKEAFDGYDPDRGRFRSFLKICLERYLSNAHKASRRQKRGGEFPFRFEIDAIEIEIAASTRTPEEDMCDAFDRGFASALVSMGIDELRELCKEREKPDTFAIFEAYVLSEADVRPTYAELATRHGLSVFDVTNRLAFARREFRRLILSHLRTLTSNEDEFQQEAREVLGV